MKKRMLIVFCFFCCFASLVWAAPKINVDLVKEHGQGLKKASFYLRFKFEKTTGTRWTESTYKQRKAFLEKYYMQKAADEKKEQESLKKKLLEEKELARAKRAEERSAADAQRAQHAQERQESKDKAAESRAFQKEVDARAKEISDMRRQQQDRPNTRR